MLTVRWNSTPTPERPSKEELRIALMPPTVFAASSIGRVTSFSTCSGEAPGYWVSMNTAGISTLGMFSTPRLR